MIVSIENCLFLKSEKKEFKNQQGDSIKYTTVNFVDDENNFVQATLNKDFAGDLPDERSDCDITLELSEREGSRGKYVKKSIISIT